MCDQYESDPMEWADLSGEIGEMEKIISKIHDDDISSAASEVERQIKAQLCSTVEYLHEELPKCNKLSQFGITITDAQRKMN